MNLSVLSGRVVVFTALLFWAVVGCVSLTACGSTSLPPKAKLYTGTIINTSYHRAGWDPGSFEAALSLANGKVVFLNGDADYIDELNLIMTKGAKVQIKTTDISDLKIKEVTLLKPLSPSG